MCGIVGVVSRTGLAPNYPIERMRDALAHRGPDDRGTWWSPDRRIGFGHRRLAVIDLTVAGHQPMRSASGRSAVVLNGEIYNYRDLRAELEARGTRFRSHSDTEVLIEGYEAWGVDVLARLTGMFALAVADLERGTVLLARDRAGEKPLFIGETGDRILFGSELKALLADPAVPRVIDLEALDSYLAYGYVPGPRCLLRGFRKLPPAHALLIDAASGTERQWRYWLPPPSPGGRDPADRETRELDTFETLLGQAVGRQLVSDVPVGVLLSGGVDSSLVAALAARRSASPVRTFTVTFPGHSSHDEGPHARRVAEHLGTRHTEIEAEAASVDLLPVLARQFDEPIGDSALVPTALLARAVRREVTVALGGDGSDELFGGYPHYQWIMHLARLRRAMPSPVRAVASRLGSALPIGLTGRHHLIGLAGEVGETIAHVNMYFDRASRRSLVPRTRAITGGVLPETWRAGLAAGEIDPRERAMRTDFASTLVDGYLVRVDRASMLSALEVRAPFLDHHLIEFACGQVPTDLKVTRHQRKILPAALAAKLLPPEYDHSRKQGFTMPLGAWFSRGWGTFFADTLLADAHLFNPAAVDRLVSGQHSGRHNVERLFALTMLALWRKEYRVSL